MVSRFGICSSIKEDLHRLPSDTKNGKRRVNGPLRRRDVHRVLLDEVKSFRSRPLPRCLLLDLGASTSMATIAVRIVKGYANEP